MSRIKQNSFDDNFDKNNYFDDIFEISHDKHFDEDFEITYEEELPISYHFDTQPIEHVSDETIAMDTNDFDYDNCIENSEDFADDYEEERRSDYEDDSDYDYEEDYDYMVDSGCAPSRRRTKSKKHSMKKHKYGTKSIYRTARLITRLVSLAITAGTFGFLAYNFWHGAAPYGDPVTLFTNQLAEPDYTLLGYAAVAALVLMFELIAFFWSMTRARLRDGRHIYKEDTGRGLFSFIFIYAAALLSFLLCTFLPETMPYAVLNGIRGALDLFGSLHNSLFGLCLAGVISCIVRRNMI